MQTQTVSALEGNCVSRGAEVMDYYQVLGLSFDQRPSADQIRRAYHEQARRSHPDKNQHNPAAVSHFQAVQAAYSTLSCPTKRQTYDATCQQASRQPPRRPYPSQAPQPQGHSARPQSAFTPRYTAVWSDAVSYRMSCGKCAGYHMWQPTARFPHEARWCPCCATHHEALEGEGWAEHPPSIFSFLSRTRKEFYCLSRGTVYKCTEWAQCHRVDCPPGTHGPGIHVIVVAPHSGSPSDRPAGSENCSSTRSNQRNTSSDIPRTPRPRLVEALPDSLLVRLLKQPLQGAGMQCQLQLRPADGSAPWLPFLCVKGSLQLEFPMVLFEN
ncbi:hypothetical protein CYMTET_57020 [Cymbomonas tetramitiformis]|uniref:J domain-containing protein n=1 Tax=Cymbomonas tetramitiformis TaxID=36881 RepID=A0AAE0BA59_9CHLO|nr:hypothetical protein CYMTET_57020 [Cymbomonas tetramitiformis]